MTRAVFLAGLSISALAFLLLRAGESAAEREAQLARHRNLGKAFYETPGSQMRAVEEFRKALELNPESARDRLNYGLALLRAGKEKEGAAELERAQKQDPSIPHTWFNLGIAYKREGEYERAIRQFRRLMELAPAEPTASYNLGVLYKLTGRGDFVRQFERAARLDPGLAAPHFQLYNAYRQAGRKEDAARELALFEQIKKRQENLPVPEDMEWSGLAEIYEVIEPKAAESGAGAPLRFRRVTLAGKADPATAGIVLLDVNGDGRPEALVWSAKGIVSLQGPRDRALAQLKGVAGIAPGDFNNDGLADLCVLTGEGPALYVNRKGRFTRKEAGLPAGSFEKALWLDYDHDYDLDLFLLGANPVLLRNLGDGRFQRAEFAFAEGHAIDAAFFRLVPDSKGMDLLVSHQDRGGVLYRDRLGGRFEAVPVPALPAQARSLMPVDVDHDGWIDVAFRSPAGVGLLRNECRSRGEPCLVLAKTAAAGTGGFVLADLENRGLADLVAGNAVYRGLGLGRFAPPQTPAGLVNGTVWAAADFDADGRTDLAAVSAEGGVHLLRNVTPLANQWMRVGLAGLRNLKLARAAEVEVKAGASYQKQIYAGVPLSFGLGAEKMVDTVRITWPNGLIQNEPKQAAGRSYTYREAERLSGSCPMIFAWNGREFQFVTDVLGVAPLGASAGDGEYFPVDHDEAVQIPEGGLAPLDRQYEIRITEELREVSYLDQVRLIAVDHPAQVEIFTNDKFKAPPFPDFRLFGVRKRVYPRAAADESGDVLPALVRRDRRYADRFRRDYSGVAELHRLDLDFGPGAARGNRAILVLNGWTDWADGSTFLGAAQRGQGLILPYLQVKDATGQWRTVVEDMGIPAGKPKTIVVDLTGKFLSASREIRIVTNLCVYWDEVLLSEETEPPAARVTSLAPRTAELRFRGFSKPVIHPERRQPEWFDYARVSPVSMWNQTPGLYTRYGDVGELLGAVDDRFVIMGSGDELRLRFDPAALPAAPGGWKRGFLLLVDGWAKDGDLNTAFSQSVEPLPFHGMSRYPYSHNERYPGDAFHTSYRKLYNTRAAFRLIQPLHTSARR